MKCNKSCCYYPCSRDECEGKECEHYKSIITEAQELIDKTSNLHKNIKKDII